MPASISVLGLRLDTTDSSIQDLIKKDKDDKFKFDRLLFQFNQYDVQDNTIELGLVCHVLDKKRKSSWVIPASILKLEASISVLPAPADVILPQLEVTNKELKDTFDAHTKYVDLTPVLYNKDKRYVVYNLKADNFHGLTTTALNPSPPATPKDADPS